jgi:hypothetical protein
MVQEKAQSYNFLRKNWWITVLLTLSVTGGALSIWGLGLAKEKVHFLNSLYETFQMFLLHHVFPEEMPWQLQVGRWVIFAAFLWATFRLFFEIIAPQVHKNLKILVHQNHIIICGLNKMTINLVEKYSDKQIVVLAEETNKYAETLKAKNVILLIGDFTDESIWWKAKLKKASRLFAVIDNDKMNVKIARSVFSYLENKTREKEALKCFVLIKDRELKTILEESDLFKYKTATFDGIPFNISEIGMKYGIATNIDKILPEEIKTPPEILLIGLTEKTEVALLNLVHCLTMQRESFRFTIVEKNTRRIRYFQRKYSYLQDFAEIKTVSEIEIEKQFDSVLVCNDNPIEAIKQAVEIRYRFGENRKDKNILVFCYEPDTLNEVLKSELEKKKIFIVNLFGEIAEYIFELDKNIEEKAKETHHFWNTLYKQNKEWDEMPGHFRQSNRNQILDNYLRIYIARSEKFGDFKNRLISFSDDEKETLARMEQRRWMLEKLRNGWVLGERNNELKRHDCLIPWEELSEVQQAKDYDAINLMIKLLDNQ